MPAARAAAMSTAGEREPGGVATLGGDDRGADPGGGKAGEQGVDTRIRSDEPGGVGQVPLPIGPVQLMTVLGGLLQQGRQEWASDPGLGPFLRHLLVEHTAERMLIGGDDEGDGVHEGAVEVEQDRGGSRRCHQDILPNLMMGLA